ncbi:MAG: phosphatase PAP2-related protein [Candidatus Paceibacterota bacterium]
MEKRTLVQEYLTHFRDKEYVTSLIIAFLLLFGSLMINISAGTFATNKASNFVNDIILSNIPVVNVDELFIYAPIIFWVILCIYCALNPKKLPFWLKSIALFTVVRSVFMSLTHIGPFPDRIDMDSFNLFKNLDFYIFSSGGDLFFSGHTGLPFLSALIFWDNFRLRVFCIISSVFFGIIVLLGHLHYSIDVLSAFFITYAIYHIALQLFPADKKRFSS